MTCRNCGRRMDRGIGPCVWCGAERGAGGPPDSEPDPRIGTTLEGKYRLDTRIGAGGMGAVYRATRVMIGDQVAVKILHADQLRDPEAAERFRREAQAAARLKHDNVVTIHDFGVADDGTLFLVMEFVEGESLRRLIEREGPVPPSVAAEILAQVCSALDEAHAQGIVHRDIKPDNILVTRRPAGLHVEVLDFGIARVGHTAAAPAGDLTQAGRILGTPHYMSPEQCLGEELDGRSDLYSLGVVLYEMLSGTVPFDATTAMGIVVKQVNDPPTPLHERKPDIPPAVEAVVEAALRKRRDERPASAGTLAAQLEHAVTEAAGTPSPASAGAGARRTTGGPAPTMRMRAARTGDVGGTGTAGGGRRRRRTGFWTGVAAAAAVATTVLVLDEEWLPWRRDTEKPQSATAGADASPVKPEVPASAPEANVAADAAAPRMEEETASRTPERERPPERAPASAVPPAAPAPAPAAANPPARRPAPASARGGSLTIRALPGSAVQLDGVDAGTTDDSGILGVAGIPAGRHLLMARKEGYADAQAIVSVVAGQSDVVELSLVALPGALTVTANTPDVTVRIEGVGEYRLPVTGLEVPAGLRRVAASRPGFLPVEDAVEVRSGEAATLDFVLERVPVEVALQEAQGLFNVRQYRDAARAAEAVVTEYGDSGEAYLLLGKSRHELGRFDDSANFLGRAIELGQAVELPAKHRHGGLGLRAGFCEGMIAVSRSVVTYRSAEGLDHSFVTTPDRIREVGLRDDRIAMRIAVLEGNRERERNFDFIHPDTVQRAADERGLRTELSCRRCDASLTVLLALLQKARGF